MIQPQFTQEEDLKVPWFLVGLLVILVSSYFETELLATNLWSSLFAGTSVTKKKIYTSVRFYKNSS